MANTSRTAYYETVCRDLLQAKPEDRSWLSALLENEMLFSCVLCKSPITQSVKLITITLGASESRNYKCTCTRCDNVFEIRL